MSGKPMTKKEWMEYLKKSVDEFDWEAAGKEREWVGLTDEEIDAIEESTWDADHKVWGIHNFARAIEAKLKEKNCA